MLLFRSLLEMRRTKSSINDAPCPISIFIFRNLLPIQRTSLAPQLRLVILGEGDARLYRRAKNIQDTYMPIRVSLGADPNAARNENATDRVHPSNAAARMQCTRT